MRGKARVSGCGPGIEIHSLLMKLGCDLQKETVQPVSPWQYSCEVKLTNCMKTTIYIYIYTKIYIYNIYIFFLSDSETEKVKTMHKL